MTTRRGRWIIGCKTEVIGPFRSEPEAAFHLLKIHLPGLIGRCRHGLLARQHIVGQMKDPKEDHVNE